MRRETDRFIGCDLTIRERQTIDDMKARCGIARDANLVRTALYRFAQHLDQHVDTAMFAVRRHPRDRQGMRRGKAS